jgi:alcohol dehydrogenase
MISQAEYFGEGSIKNLKNILKKEKPKNVFLVTGKSSYIKSGAKKAMDALLSNLKVIHFDDFETNPKIEDINKGIKIFQQEKPDIIVAIGGGSVIDVAKSINSLSVQPGKSEDYIKGTKPLERIGKPLVAVPTTAGSGSESTHFAVVYINKEKFSLAHPSILPKHIILDPQLTFNLPAPITAATGIDALGQAIESYWSTGATRQSKLFARKAIKLIINNLDQAVNNNNKNARLAMCKASNLAGKAINISKTTACHAISYPLTSYFGIPHGHAVGLTLVSMLIFNSQVKKNDVSDSRGLRYVKRTIRDLTKIIGTNDPITAAKTINDIIKAVNLETKLSKLDIKADKDIDLIIKNGFNPQRVKNNPRVLTQSSLLRLLKKLM